MLNRKWSHLLIVLFIVVALAIAACGDDDSADGDVHEITIRALPEIRYEPNEVTVKTGEQVRIVFVNSDENSMHDMTFPDMPVRDVQIEGATDFEMNGENAIAYVAVDGGETATLTEAGIYEFHCTVGCQADIGMSGSIIVED